MNQALLTRLFKSIEGDQETPLMRIAFSIIEDEKKKGHSKLAEKLNNILLSNLAKPNNKRPTLKVAKDISYKVPVDRRYRLPLATHIPHECLRHEMVLNPEVENKLLRIEKEYLALVEGIPQSKQFTIDKPIGKLKGSKRAVGKEIIGSQRARTGVEWLRSIGGRSLLRVIPRSGRTNQIRVHLTSVGLPIYNDSVYGRGKVCDREFGLHHRRMQFQCLDTKIELIAACPAHFQPYIRKLIEVK